MSVAVLIPESWSPSTLISWASRFARARGEALVVICCARRKSETPIVRHSAVSDSFSAELTTALQLATAQGFAWQDSSGDKDATASKPAQAVEVWEVSSTEPVPILLSEIRTAGIRLLILPRYADAKTQSSEFEMERELFRDATCETMQIRLGTQNENSATRIAVGLGQETEDAAALNLAASLAAAEDGRVTALYVEPDDGYLSDQVAQRVLRQSVSRNIRVHPDRVDQKVVLNDDFLEGMHEGTTDHELLVLGAAYHGAIHRLLFSSKTERLLSSPEGPTVAVVRAAMPLGSRARRALESWLQNYVPQLDRQSRVDLFQRVHSSSRWDFDFIVLIGLSTLIAGLGLAQDSAAVVIGAMLVAPLMTPLLGTGLAVVQGNSALVKTTVSTVTRGFALAFLVGLAIGLLLPGVHLTDEMRARGSPGLTDMLVAFVSGLVAAYANGRPNLVSALPGVAIAAALVPPVATSGICLALGETAVFGGALLLFLTNIVAIILSAACSLWGCGIRGTHQHGGLDRWTIPFMTMLLFIAIVIGTYEAMPRHSQHRAVQRHLNATLQEDCPTVSLESMKLEKAAGKTTLLLELSGPAAKRSAAVAAIEKLRQQTELDFSSVKLKWTDIQILSD